MGFTLYVFVTIVWLVSSKEIEVHECGKPIGLEFRLIEERIVAGYDIGYYRYPWYAALVQYGNVNCGGALIGPRTVLTAAHCYKQYLNSNLYNLESIYTVRLGVYNICETESTQRTYKVQKVHIHEDYYKKKPYYDICLLTLDNETTNYEPICLPKADSVAKAKDGTVPGLGTLRYQGAMPCTVHEARLLVYNDSECHEMINSTGNDPDSITHAFCAGYKQGGIDTCQGDSGGPLQTMNAEGKYFLSGIVSFGFRCALPGLLGMYTDVSAYLDWIQEKSGLNATVAAVYNKTSPELPSKNKRRHHRRRYHLGTPFRRPMRVILYKDNKIDPITRSMLHYPLIWDN